MRTALRVHGWAIVSDFHSITGLWICCMTARMIEYFPTKKLNAIGFRNCGPRGTTFQASTSLAYFVTVPQNDYKNVAYMSFLERSKCIICLCLNQPSTIGYINPVRPTTCQRCKRSVTEHKNVEYSSSL